MDYVVHSLFSVFQQDATNANAHRIMLEAHASGTSIAGSYSCEQAEARIDSAHGEARECGLPLPTRLRGSKTFEKYLLLLDRITIITLMKLGF